MAWVEVTAEVYRWKTMNGRVVVRLERGVHEVTRDCLREIVAAGAGREMRKPRRDAVPVPADAPVEAEAVAVAAEAESDE